VEARFFNTPEKLADSRYNLACVYARLGRADEAIPLLREALAANPELAAWARKDADLDRIREELAPILS
jgi:tetratricopeptide (TPR) repeat protein